MDTARSSAVEKWNGYCAAKHDPTLSAEVGPMGPGRSRLLRIPLIRGRKERWFASDAQRRVWTGRTADLDCSVARCSVFQFVKGGGNLAESSFGASPDAMRGGTPMSPACATDAPGEQA